MEEIKCLNTNPCTCPNTACPRHGRCCECVKWHRDNKGNIPNCYKFPPEGSAYLKVLEAQGK